MKLTIALSLIGLLQVVLGIAYLAAPAEALAWMGHSRLAPDLAYPMAMLAARFLVYGVLLWLAARAPARHRLLIDGMIAIQVVDLAAGLLFTARGIVPLSLSGFPMVDAALIIVALALLRPRAPEEATA